MSVPGVFASDSGIQSDRKGDFAGALLQTMPTGSATLFALTSGMNSMGAGDVLVTWFEENHISGRVSATAGYNSSATTIVVSDGSSYIPGTILMVEESGEYLYVTAIAGNSLTVVRGFAGTTAASITQDKFVQRIGTAHEEGSSKPRAVANIGYPVFNYMQIFRNAWNVTGTARAVTFHTGDRVAKNKLDASNFHAEDIERSLLFGRKGIGHKNGEPFRMMDGVLSFIKTNVTAAGVTTNYDQLDTFLEGVFARNIKGKPNERIAFGGNGSLQVLNTIARIEGDINITTGQTDFGLAVTKWVTPYGTISLMTHPLLTESPLWTKDMYVLHPGAITTRYLRRTTHDENEGDGTRAGNDQDFGVYTTEMSVMYQGEMTGGKLTGLTKGAAVS